MSNKRNRKNKSLTQKRIGIVMNYKQLKKGKAMGVDYTYTKYFSKFGRVVHINPFDSQLEEIDLLVLPGGRDVNPLRYDAAPDEHCGVPDLSFEYFDKYVLQEYINAGVAVFGICRGMQSLFVHSGGEMVQDVDHYVSLKRTERVEPIKLLSQQPCEINVDEFNSYKEIMSNGKKVTRYDLRTNSLHHQIIDESTTPNNVVITAISRWYQTPEAFMRTDAPICGVQWHPEECQDAYSHELIMHLLTQNNSNDNKA